MSIPVSCGRLRFVEGACFLEHRSTSNHPMRILLVRALPDDTPDSSEGATRLFLDQLGLREGDQIFVDGFLVGGEDSALSLAVRGVTAAPAHQGILSFHGAQASLRKAVGTRLLRRFGDPVLAAQMLRSCGKQDGDLIQVFGLETVSTSGVPSIEISSVVGC